MKLFPRLTLTAAAIALLATTAPAFADETLTQKTTQNSNGVNTNSTNDRDTSNVYGFAFQNASGNIGLNQADGQANMQQNLLYIDGGTNFAFTGTFGQSSSGDINNDTQSGLGFNDNEVYGNSFENASGRIGVNQAAGNGNKQLNAAVIGDASGKTLVTTMTQNIDRGSVNSTSDFNTNFIYDSAFKNASGDIGVSEAAGNLNQQMNSLVVATDSALTSSSQTITQTLSSTAFVSNSSGKPNSGTNDNEIYGNAFQNAKGNIGVNQAAGNGNLQANTAVVLH